VAISAPWTIREDDPALVRYGANVVGAASLCCEGEEFKVRSPAFRPQALGVSRKNLRLTLAA
jgi:hypothetical protein